MDKRSKLGRTILLIGILISHSAFSQKILKLEEAMEIALKNSPDIIQSELNMVISEENLKAQEALTKSNFSLEIAPFAYSRTRTFNDLTTTWITNENKQSFGNLIVTQPIVKTDGVITLRNDFGYLEGYNDFYGVRSKTYSNDFYLTLSQPLFTYNKQKMQIEKLRMALENATLGYSIQRLYLEQKVTFQFYDLYKSVMSLRIAEEDYNNQKTSYDIIKSKVEGGLSPSAELYQAEVNLATSESNLQNQRLTLENAKDNFRQYIGMPLSEDFTTEADTMFNQVNVDLPFAVKSGLETRMELKQRDIIKKNSEYDLVVAKATNEFKANANLSFGIKGDNPHLPQIYDKPTRSPQVLLTLSVPIWDWGERRARIKAAEASMRIEEIHTESLKTSIELQIRQSWRNLQNLQMQIDIAKKNERNAQLTYEINLDRYKNGDLTSKDLGQYQTQLSQAKLNMVNSLINYKLELLNMKIQSLWDFENSSSFVPKTLQKNINPDTKK